MIRIRMRTHDDLQPEIQEVTRATRQKYEQISRDNQVTRNHRYLHIFSPETVTCRPRLDCENFKVIIQIFTGCKWELICTLPTLIGKQIEKLHCQLSPGPEHWQDGATDNQRINTRQNTENTVTAPGPRRPVIDWDLLNSNSIPLPPCFWKTLYLQIASFLHTTRSWMQIFTDLSPHFHVWSYLFRFVCLVS